MCPDTVSKPRSLASIVSPAARQAAKFLRKTETFHASLQIEPKRAGHSHTTAPSDRERLPLISRGQPFARLAGLA